MEFLLNYLWLLHFIFVYSGGKSVSAVTQPGGAPIFTLVNKHQLRHTLKEQRQGSRRYEVNHPFRIRCGISSQYAAVCGLRLPWGSRGADQTCGEKPFSSVPIVAQELLQESIPGFLEGYPYFG